MFRSVLSIVVTAVLLLAPAQSRAEFNFLAAVPSDYEVAASFDTRQIIDSEVFQEAWQESKRPWSEARLSLLKSISGVDLLSDIDRVSIFARVNDDNSVGVAFQGRFDEPRLVLIAQANSSYDSFEAHGYEIHQWFDDRERRMKFGSFPAPGVLMIWNSKEAAEASLAALSKNTDSFKDGDEAGLIPADASLLAGWGVMITRQGRAHLQLSAATMTLDLAGEQLGANVQAIPRTTAIAQQWLDMARGAKALAMLQRDKPAMADFASRLVIEPVDDGRVISITYSISNEELLECLKSLKR